MNTPTVTFKSITFSDGSTIQLSSTDIVVLVGPNNAGKSVALRELKERFGNTSGTIVIKYTEKKIVGKSEDFISLIEKYLYSDKSSLGIYIRCHEKGIFIAEDETLEEVWRRDMEKFAPLLCTWISTETRITDSNPENAIDYYNERPTRPIQMIFLDNELESKISKYFRLAFGKDLIIFHAGGKQIPLLVGKRPSLVQGEQLTSRTYSERLRNSTVPLERQGDGMRSFASVILHLLSSIDSSMIFIDEPEAFLHPSQASLLGEIIAKVKSPHAQLFTATHSADTLHGLINAAPNNLRVLRMQRDGNVNRIKELDKSLVNKISSDPLMKHSSVVSGVFHERVIICEADADCMFYNSLLDLQEVHGDRRPDVLFVHAGGKHRMATLAETLVALDVPVDIITDIDVLNDMRILEGIIKALDGDWAAIEPRATAVKRAIEEHKPWLNVNEIKKGIEGALAQEPSSGESVKQLRSRINAIFQQASPWDAVKNAGEAALPPGQATQQFQNLQELCKEMGLWIVPVGEMEGFCKSVGGHGPDWVRNVITERDLATDPELAHARNFVHEIWKRKQRNRL